MNDETKIMMVMIFLIFMGMFYSFCGTVLLTLYPSAQWVKYTILIGSLFFLTILLWILIIAIKIRLEE